MVVRLPPANLRLAIVRKVFKTFVQCDYLGHGGERSIDVPKPYTLNGGGILVGIQPGALVLIGKGPGEQKFIVAHVPLKKEYFDQEGLEDSPIYNTPLPSLEGGEILIKSPVSNAYIDLLPRGNIMIDANISNTESDIEMSPLSRTLYLRSDNKYHFTEAGRYIEGVVKRDLNKSEDESDTDTLNFLAGDVYDDLLSQIGRSPADEVQNRTTTIVRNSVRNPALVERRQVIYEYADSFGVRNMSAEASAMIKTENSDGLENLVKSAGRRPDRRTDVFNLDMYNYNHLMEKIEGTAVDIYGNILDINRNIVRVPDAETLDSSSGDIKALQNLYRYMRRSIKYHFEMNSRKEINGDEPSRKSVDQYAREHSRWSIDVDGEGLTKINIPASSDTGNIPVLNRHVTSVKTGSEGEPLSESRDDGSYRDEKFVDVKSIQFGVKDGYSFTGVEIFDSEYRPVTFDNNAVTTTGTTYHDLLNIAPLVFDSGKLRNPDPAVGAESVPPMSSKVDNKIESNEPNAGGRSLHANLDGSAEISIGADTIDNKSMLLDMQGAMISHFGKDNNGRSIIHQSDGDVIIQVGGAGIDDTGERPGRIEIHLARGDRPAQKIVIDESGMTMDIQGNMLLSSTGDFTVAAGGKLLLTGELIFNYGDFDNDIDGTRAPTGTERMVIRNGVPNHL